MKSKNIIDSFKYAFSGLIYGIRNERNIKVHFSIMLIVIFMGILFKINLIEWSICIILFGMVISLEYVNTAIESVVNICSPEKNELAKISKDMAASAVVVVAIVSLIVGMIIFLPKILESII